MVNHRSPPIASDGPRILVIEDEPLIAQMIEEMLQEAGYRVSGVAHTMAKARQDFVKRNFDAVLFDINIGGRYHRKQRTFCWTRACRLLSYRAMTISLIPVIRRCPYPEKPFTAEATSRPIGRAS